MQRTKELIRYKVFSHVDNIRQNTTTIDITDSHKVDLYNRVNEVLYDRFEGYKISINHTGKTVTIDYKVGE